MYREALQRFRESIARLARRAAVAVRIIPPVRLTIIGARGGTITASSEGRTISVRHPERVTMVLPRGVTVYVRADPDPRHRFVALRIDGEEINRSEHIFRIVEDTVVTAIFEPKYWRVQVMWQLIVPERYRSRDSPRVSAEARIYVYTVAEDEREAEQALREDRRDADDLFEELRDPACCRPPDSALTSFDVAEERRRAFIDRIPAYGMEVVEVDADEVEEPDAIFAYAAIYRRNRLRHSYKWRRDSEEHEWVLIERDGRPA